MNYYEVAIAGAYTNNKFYTYKSENNLDIGAVVKVQFGPKLIWAIVMSVVKKPSFNVKEIPGTAEYQLPGEYLDLMRWMFGFYPDDNGSITQLFVPGKVTGKQPLKPMIFSAGKGNKLPVATPEQKQVLKMIDTPTTKRVLLHGDTGTGKTRVYLEIAKDLLSKGRSVLILTPEIGLTPQLITDLEKYLDVPIILTHSNLSPNKRAAIWQYTINNRQPAVFVGPRSALFLPINNLGLIVIDEAHDSSYKQMQSPKYQVLNVAGKLAALQNALLIQSTATPNVDEYETAKAHNYSIVTMSETAAGNKKSNMHIVDIKQRDNFTKSPHLSNDLVGAIQAALTKGEQIMLFLNRRGSARLVQCSNCGWQALCPRCNIPMVYHHDRFVLRCHTCGLQQPTPNSCPKCNSPDIIFKIIGTKALFEHVAGLFPRANIVRFDADSPASEQYHRNINVLKNGQVDIIIGTQLITKGIDLPRLSTVGIINADSGLNLPDYRSEEITFQQLYQVTGRAARGHVTSQAYIQTRLPGHPVMLAVKNRSWTDFYEYELPKRQQYNYPPKVFLAVLTTTAQTSKTAENNSNRLISQLKKPSLEILGPSPSFYHKSSSGYNWQIIIKSTNRSNIVAVTKDLPSGWVVDIDPSSLL